MESARRATDNRNAKHWRSQWYTALVLAVMLAVSQTVVAQTDVQVATNVETLLDGLDVPAGIAVQPETGHIFVAENGAARVLRFNPRKPGESSEVVSVLTAGAEDPESMFGTGPRALGFLDRGTFVVGNSGAQDAEAALRIFKVPVDGSSVAADEGTTFGLRSDERTFGNGAVTVHGLAVSTRQNAVYVVISGNDPSGSLCRATFRDSEPSALEPLFDIQLDTGADVRAAIVMHREGYVVIGQMGSRDRRGDSRLTMFRPDDKKMVLNRAAGMHDICALAYGPANRLYAAEFAWFDPSQGGLYRLDSIPAAAGPSIRATLVAALEKPTAMAFGHDGVLYATVTGTPVIGSTEKTGRLVRVTFTDAD